ncbi:carbon storage regulator [Niallia circulans]|uniref:Translational regulator CsrA n=1 Tax=Shouchella clausii TaxID=79880 RepID=A0A268RV83_SHOCL|nr:carbon storage regulator CsrA [Shouchella clausii]PAD41065.1 carbon storage regulator [Bacillus sp. 7520-S]SPT80930.1 carbon storage regulator [Niallia circulans]AST96715.1 carbon storage regulator [Shouchella clausii]MBU8596720.1 carbon storage regulator CsrA [Shouchella clausii]MCR1289652.1 carbon storage regulator CsrA [Shouchella clausii]
MLVLSRKANEAIRIMDDIEIKVLAVEGDQVKLGISAPKSVDVHRGEVYEAIQEENKHAAKPVSAEILQAFINHANKAST